MISAGEASGDLHAANLVKALHKIDNSIQFRGMGGEKLVQAGVDILVDCSDIRSLALLKYWSIIEK